MRLRPAGARWRRLARAADADAQGDSLGRYRDRRWALARADIPPLDGRLLPVISPALAESKPIATPANLARHLLLVVTGRPLVWRQWFHKHELPDAAMRLGPQFELTSHLVQAVAAGLGVGLVPSCLVEDELRDGSLQLAIASPLQTGLGYYLFVPPILPPPQRLKKRANRNFVEGIGLPGPNHGRRLAHCSDFDLPPELRERQRKGVWLAYTIIEESPHINGRKVPLAPEIETTESDSICPP